MVFTVSTIEVLCTYTHCVSHIISRCHTCATILAGHIKAAINWRRKNRWHMAVTIYPHHTSSICLVHWLHIKHHYQKNLSLEVTSLFWTYPHHTNSICLVHWLQIKHRSLQNSHSLKGACLFWHEPQCDSHWLIFIYLFSSYWTMGRPFSETLFFKGAQRRQYNH